MESLRPACTFTGHREEKLPWRSDEDDARCQTLKAQIAGAIAAVYRAGVSHFICGMATGGDMYFGEAVLALRAEHGEITLEAAVPWEGQASSWAPPLKARHARLLADCDYHTLVQKDYTPDCLMRRNRYMVDNASVLIAAYSGRPGGTMRTLLYAIRKGLQVIELPV